ncbi:MBL fold metallo-hydrolase [Desulfococcaceae bacterium HSG8]|nr:MBL fold metallo-hydrolase [Desulfococcaceae bacterium HSG8]
MESDNGKMSVTILGSGTCTPSLRRSACSALVEIGNTKLLFDCGPGTMRRLLEAGTTIFDISFIFLSHFHPDHTGELVSFLFSSKYAGGKPRETPLTIVAGKGLAEFHDKLKTVYGPWIEIGILNIVELDNTVPDSRSFENFTADSIPVEHNDESIAYRIQSPDGTSVVYSGDTDFSENLITLAENADLLICESALPDELKVRGHLTPSLAGKIAARANVRKLVLTHFYPECEQIDIEKECRKHYTGPLILAEDLMKIDLPNYK